MRCRGRRAPSAQLVGIRAPIGERLTYRLPTSAAEWVRQRRPSALTVLRLISSSNVVGWQTSDSRVSHLSES